MTCSNQRLIATRASMNFATQSVASRHFYMFIRRAPSRAKSCMRDFAPSPIDRSALLGCYVSGVPQVLGRFFRDRSDMLRPSCLLISSACCLRVSARPSGAFSRIFSLDMIACWSSLGFLPDVSSGHRSSRSARATKKCQPVGGGRRWRRRRGRISAIGLANPEVHKGPRHTRNPRSANFAPIGRRLDAAPSIEPRHR